MPTKQNYQVKYKREGGATFTSTILGSSEGDAAAVAVKKFKATEILTIKKVK